MVNLMSSSFPKGLFVFQIKAHIRSIDFQSESVSFTTEKVLSLTEKVSVVLVHKYVQQLQLLALHLEMLGYIPGLLNGLVCINNAFLA